MSSLERDDLRGVHHEEKRKSRITKRIDKRLDSVLESREANERMNEKGAI